MSYHKGWVALDSSANTQRGKGVAGGSCCLEGAAAEQVRHKARQVIARQPVFAQQGVLKSLGHARHEGGQQLLGANRRREANGKGSSDSSELLGGARSLFDRLRET